MELTLQQKLEKVRRLRPIDDVFFEVLADDTAVCQEILSTILQDPGLVVESVIVQNSKKNLYGRSVRLDALCVLGDGRRVNIEVQRSDHDDHLKRARYNASAITVHDSQTGEDFSEIPEVYIVYISEFDFLSEGRTIYHIDKVIRESGTVVDDGLQEIFVNSAVDDGSKIADLMACFMQTEVNDPQFPVLSDRVHQLKQTEGGASAVCTVMQEYEKIALEQGRAEGRAEGRTEGESLLAKVIKRLRSGVSEETLRAEGISQDTINLARECIA